VKQGVNECPLASDSMNLYSQIEWKWCFSLNGVRGCRSFYSSSRFDTIEKMNLGYRDGCLGVGSVLTLNVLTLQDHVHKNQQKMLNTVILTE